MADVSTTLLQVTKITSEGKAFTTDALAIEEPLEIRIEYGPAANRQVKNISVTMRTPGHDLELAIGFLFTEGIINSVTDIGENGHYSKPCAKNKENTILIKLKEDVAFDLQKLDRNFYTTSSCGVCGKASIEAIRTISSRIISQDDIEITSELLHSLPDILRNNQEVFGITGGLHASALFDTNGQILIAREDVGRHNALDKLIGAALNLNMLPLNSNVLMLSGRMSFELIQKAAMGGIKIVVAIGAPSSLAVELAHEFNITLIGFLRDERFNIYSGEQRVRDNYKPLYDEPGSN
ncbi:MAG TPA: formate dehydrogenase accessory sulfurtransferase FdhD [Pedobacter sp.]|jgi:FdhD protein